MRYHEIILDESATLEEAILYETFLSNLLSAAGGKINQQISNVTNAATAAQVLYRVMSNPSYTETATFLLKKAIKNKLKNMDDSPLKQAISSKFPPGRSGKDFLKGIIIICILNGVAMAKTTVTTQIVDQLINKVTNLEELITQILNVGIGGFGTVLSSLGIANTILFQVLTDINTKITNAQGSA